MSDSSIMKLYEEMLNKTQEVVEQGYEAKNQRAENAYHTTIAALKQNYMSDAGQTNRQYDASIDQQNQITAKALKDAYVGKRLGERNIGQQLAALGRTGGAAESTLLGMQNNYQTNRAGLESERSRAIENFNLERANALNNLMTALNTETAKANDLYQERQMDATDDMISELIRANEYYGQKAIKEMADNLMRKMEGEAKAAAGSAKSGSGGNSGSSSGPTLANVSNAFLGWNQSALQEGLSAGERASMMEALMKQQGYSKNDIEATKKVAGLK